MGQARRTVPAVLGRFLGSHSPQSRGYVSDPLRPILSPFQSPVMQDQLSSSRLVT